MPYISRPAAGQIIDPAWGTLVADAVVMRFSTAAQRTSQLTAPVVGQLTALDTAPGVLEYWTGSVWAPVIAGREIAYTQVTAPKSVVAVVETSADAVVQGPALTFDGTTAVIVEVFTPAVLPPAAAGAYLMVFLYQDGASVGRLASLISPTAAQASTPVLAARRLTPTAGSHSFTFAAIVSGGSGSVQAGPGGVGQYMPAYLRVTRAT